MTTREEFAKMLSEDVLMNIDYQLKELSEKEYPNLEDKNKLEFFKKLQEDKKTPLEMLRDCYYEILDILENYMEIGENEKKVIALWIIGTTLHNSFNCYPYLFFNAMRGSGKTRLMKIISFLAHGILTTSPTESVLFRTKDLLALDEFERMDAKEKMILKEMLNTAYKKGLFVLRNSKKKVLGQETYVTERFETYRPIIMANIWGMDDVLGDRCISLVLEKSENPLKTKKIEDFENDELMLKVRKTLIQCRLCSDVMSQNINNIIKRWNLYLNDRYKTPIITTLTTHITLTTLTTQDIQLDEFLRIIDNSEINGRSLELFFPLFIIADKIDRGLLKEIINFAKTISQERKANDELNKDVLLYKFVAEQNFNSNYNSIKELTNHFKLFIGEESEDWINPKWLGRALKRLNLITSHRRVGNIGAQVILNVAKAKEKAKMFESSFTSPEL